MSIDMAPRPIRNHNYRIEVERLDFGGVKATSKGRVRRTRRFDEGTTLEAAALALAELIEGDDFDIEVRITVELNDGAVFATYRTRKA